MSETSSYITAHLQNKIIESLPAMHLQVKDILLLNYVEVSCLKIQKIFPEANIIRSDSLTFDEIESKFFDLMLIDLTNIHRVELRKYLDKILNHMNDRTLACITTFARGSDKHFKPYHSRNYPTDTHLITNLKQHYGLNYKHYLLPVMDLPCKTKIKAKVFFVSLAEIIKPLCMPILKPTDTATKQTSKRSQKQPIIEHGNTVEIINTVSEPKPKPYNDFLANRQKQIEEGIKMDQINQSEFKKNEMIQDDIRNKDFLANRQRQIEQGIKMDQINQSEFKKNEMIQDDIRNKAAELTKIQNNKKNASRKNQLLKAK